MGSRGQPRWKTGTDSADSNAWQQVLLPGGIQLEELDWILWYPSTEETQTISTLIRLLAGGPVENHYYIFWHRPTVCPWPSGGRLDVEVFNLKTVGFNDLEELMAQWPNGPMHAGQKNKKKHLDINIFLTPEIENKIEEKRAPSLLIEFSIFFALYRCCNFANFPPVALIKSFYSILVHSNLSRTTA